jgi:hypothetical protein
MLPQMTPPTEPQNYIFNPNELQRLAVYRAAVVARFYTDECDPFPRRGMKLSATPRVSGF